MAFPCFHLTFSSFVRSLLLRINVRYWRKSGVVVLKVVIDFFHNICMTQRASSSLCLDDPTRMLQCNFVLKCKLKRRGKLETKEKKTNESIRESVYKKRQLWTLFDKENYCFRPYLSLSRWSTGEESVAGLSWWRTADRKTSEEMDRQHHWVDQVDLCEAVRLSQYRKTWRKIVFGSNGC